MSDELRKVKIEIKKKKPVFRRVEKHRKKALPDNWRKPKGHHSKIRRGKRWEMKMPKEGRMTPKVLKNKDKLGRDLIMINNVEDLKLLNNNNVGIVSGKLGLKKKALIAEQCKGKNYNFLNFKIDDVLSKAQKKKESKKKVKKLETKEPVAKKAEKPTKKPSKPIKKPVKPKKGDSK